MNDTTWQQVDQYIGQTIATEDQALRDALAATAAAGMPAIAVSAAQGKLLHVLARSIGARRVLELGTLGGYSTIWLARALQPDGRVLSLELKPAHAEVARKNIAAAGLADRVEVRVGAAVDQLATLQGQIDAPFDLVFADADKENLPRYFEMCLPMCRPGSLMLFDNVVRNGRLADSATDDRAIVGARQLHELVSRDDRVSATTVQMVGAKGYDGMMVVVVNRL